MSEQILLEIVNVCKSFGGVQAVLNVSFNVHKGEVFGIIGPNGSGKTTLINCITGFIKMDSGKVLYQGKDISGYPAHKIASLGITRTFQIMRPYYSLPAYKKLDRPSLFAKGEADRGLAGRRKTRGIEIP